MTTETGWDKAGNCKWCGEAGRCHCNHNGQRYYYKDFATGKRHFTRGKFIGWEGPTGPLSALYAGFRLGSHTVLWIPEYSLDPGTRSTLKQVQS